MMLSPEILVVDINGTHWRNLLSLSDALRQAGGKMPVLLLVEGETLLRAIRIGEGPIELASPWSGPDALPALREQLQASVIVVLDAKLFAEALADAESQWVYGNNLLQDILLYTNHIRNYLDRGVTVYPKLLPNLPIPSYELWKTFFDFLLPDGTAFTLYLFEGNQIWTSLVVGKNNGHIDLITTHNTLYPAPTFEDWRRERGSLVQALQRKLRPIHIGMFAEREVFVKLLSSKERGSFSRAVREGSVLFDPAPPWLRAVMGASQWVGQLSATVEKTALLGKPLGSMVSNVLGKAATVFSRERLEPARDFLARSLGAEFRNIEAPMQFISALWRRPNKDATPPETPQP